MTTQNELQHSLSGKSLSRRVLQGAGIAFVLVAIFLSLMFPVGGVLSGKGFWLGVWEFFPLVTASIGGAFGGIFYYLMMDAWNPAGWKRVVTTVVCALAYVVLFWISMVAGFAATGQWD